MIRRTALVALVAAMVMAACGGDDDEVETGDGGGDEAPGEAWVHHGHVEGTLPGQQAAVVVEDVDALSDAWDQHGFEGAPPDVDFDTHVVLLVGQVGNGCVDELTGLDVLDGRLQAQWLPPEDMMCTEQLVFRVHAVEVDRGHLPAEFTYALGNPFEDELEPVAIEIR